MTEWSAIVRRGWGVLAPPSGAQLASYPLDMFFDDTPVRIAVDRKGHRHLLVPSRGETVPPDGRQHVLGMKQAPYRFESDSASYLDIECGEPDLNAEFDDVVLDVLEALEGTSTPASSAVQTIARWRRLFSAGLRRSLSEQQRLGLFAELSLLRELLVVHPGLQATAWTGPDREPHDLELDRGCIEVKGLGRQSTVIRVHGLEQLETHDDKPLHLVLVTVAQVDDGATLHELVEELKGRFDPPGTFLAQLSKAGWSADDPLAATVGYGVESINLVRVDELTPRIVPSSLVAPLSEGITRVSYAVDVAALMAVAEPGSFSALAQELLS